MPRASGVSKSRRFRPGGLVRAPLRERHARIFRVLTSGASALIARFAFFADTEIQRDEWTASPVEQAGGKTVVLGDRQDFPGSAKRHQQELAGILNDALTPGTTSQTRECGW